MTQTGTTQTGPAQTGPARFQPVPPEPRPQRLRAGSAALALVGLVVGVPAALLALTGPPPFPRSMPTLDALSHQLGTDQVVTVLLAVVWLAWLQFAWCTLVEVAAAVRGGVLARPVPFSAPSQRLARALVALVLVSAALAPQAAFAAVADARPVAAVAALDPPGRVPGAALGQVRAGPAGVVDAGIADPRPGPDGAAGSDAGTTFGLAAVGFPTAAGWAHRVSLDDLAYGGFHAGDISELAGRKVYVVEPPVGRHHDSLWEIAQRHLGDGRRYAEIFQLNAGRTQPDGRSLQLSRLIQPGWFLVMPEDAVGVERVAAPTPPAPSAPAPTSAPAQHTAAPPNVAPHTAAPPTAAPNTAAPPTVAPAVAPSTAAEPVPVDASTAGATYSPKPTAPRPTAPSPATTRGTPSPAALPVESPLEPPAQSATPASPTTAPEHTAAPDHTTAPAPGTAAPQQTVASSSPLAQVGVAGDGTDELPRIPSPGQASNNLAAGFGASGLLAAGLLIAVQRRREQLRRRPAERTSSVIDAEVWLRVGADVPRAQLLDCGLRMLADSCARAGIDVPAIAVVTVDDEDVELRLAGSRLAAPAPWTSLDDGARWTLRRGHVPRGRIGAEAALPRLVSVGHDLADRDVLINLAAAGGPVCVHGDPRVAEHVARALAVELVTNPWSGGVHVTAVDLPETLGVVACLLDVPQDPADPLAELRGRFAAHPVGRRPLEHVVLGRPPARDVADGLRLLGADGDLGVLVAGDLPGARLRLHVDELGSLTVPDLDLRVTANRLDDATLATLAVLFTHPEPGVGTAPPTGCAAPAQVPAAAGSTRLTQAGGTRSLDASTGGTPADPRPAGVGLSGAGPVGTVPPGTVPGATGPIDARPGATEPIDARPGATGLGSRRGPVGPAGFAGGPSRAGTGMTRPRSAPPLIAIPGLRLPGPGPGSGVVRTGGDPDGPALIVTDEPDRLAGVRVPSPPVPVDDSAWVAAAARVGVIGPVAVRAPRSIDSQRTDHAAEVVAYLALHPDGVHPTVLSAALWPRGVTPDVRAAMFDRVREWLGLDEHGNPRLLLGSDGRLRLALDVVLDWDVVCTLLTSAQQTRGRRGERELLARALQLVRGPVAGGLLAAQRRGGYAWLARTDLEQTVPAVVSAAALRLSALSRSIDPASAARALRCALGADPGDQGLWRELLRCEQQQQFGRDAALQAVTAMRVVLADLEVDLEPETAALVSNLTG